MNKISISTAVGVVAGLAVLASSPVQATEGYFSNGYGAVNKSMAGAGVATGFDAMSQATNPAALTGVDSQFTVDLSVFSPNRSYQYIGGPGQDSDRNYFPIPGMAGAYKIDSASAFGWAFYANGGMNTTYPAAGPVPPSGGPFGGGKTGVDLGQAFLQFTYAREISSGVSVGISPVLAAQRFKAYGLSPAFDGMSTDPAHLSNNGYDWSYGYGGKFGLQADVGSGISLGASYQTKIFMTEFDKYAGLFAEQGDFDIPSTIQAGLAWDSGGGVIVALDYKRINYDDVAAVSNSGTAGLLGADTGAGFGWEAINAYKLGIQFEATPDLLLRAGVSYNDNPIPDTEVSFNILAPGVQKIHYTAGMTWKLDSSSAINIGAMYSPTNSVTGPFMMGGDAEIEMYQWEATVGWTWTF